MPSPIVFKINDVDLTSKLLRGQNWSLTKRHANETFSCTVGNEIWSALAYRPVVGDAVHLSHGVELLFGGQIQEVDEYRADDEGPIFVTFTASSWDLLAHQVILTGKIAASNLYDVAYQLYVDYIQLKGVTWIAASTTGGPAVPEMTFTRSTVGDILSRVTKYTNAPWRINGDKEMAIVEIGDLPFPKDPMTTADFLRGVNVIQKYQEFGTRLILQSGGTGDADHSETHTADGLKAYFMLNVEPKPDETDSDSITTSFIPTTLKVNGVDTPIDNVTWFYDTVWHMVYTTAPVTIGTTIQVSYKIAFPATVRVWEPSLLTSAGQIDIAFLVDKLVDVSFLTDVSEVKQWGEAELLRRAGTPRKITASTMVRGFYPWLVGTVELPEHNVDASFLVESVTIRDIGIDGHLVNNYLVYDLELIEGDRVGRQWEDIFTEMIGRGSTGGSIAVAGTGGTVITPGTGGGGSGGTLEYPVGHVIHLGGDNINPYPATTTYRDIPQMRGNFFGGSGFVGVWKFQAFGFQISSGTLRIELYAGSQIALATTTQVGALIVGPMGAPTAVSVTIPGSLTQLLCRYSVSSGSRNVVIGHCYLYRES